MITASLIIPQNPLMSGDFKVKVLFRVILFHIQLS